MERTKLPNAGAVGGKAAKKNSTFVKAVPKSRLTLCYERLKTGIYAIAEKVRTVFFGDSWGATVLWLAVVFVCLAALAWFFFISPLGTPAEPLYEGF